MTTTPSSSHTAVGVMVGGRSPALSALAAAVGRSPLLSSRSPPLRATAPEFQPSDFNLTTTTTTTAPNTANTNTASASTVTSLLDDEPKQSTRSSRTSSTGHADVTALTKALLAQCHYYFSDHNISKDKWMKDKLGLDDGWIPVSLLCDMPRIRQLTNDPAMLVCALRQSDKLEMSGDSQKTRRISNNPIPGNGGGGMNGNKGRNMDAKRSIFVDRLPAGHNGRTIRDLFSRFGRVDHVVALAPGGNGEGVVLESPQGTMYTLGAGEVLRGVFIEFEKQGAAKKAVSQISHFNKLLKQSKSGSSSPVTTTLQRKSSNATDSAPASPVAAAAPASSTSSTQFSSPPSTLLHDIPAALITSSSSSSTTTVTMTPYMGPSSAHSSLSTPTVPIATITSSPAIPPPVQLPAARTAPSSPTSASPSPVSPDSPVASSPTSPSSSTPSMSPVPLEVKDSGGGKKEELGDAFIGMKVMSRYAYDKKFGHLSPAIGPMVGSMAGIPIFGLAGGSPILMASPPQHVAHLATSLSASMSPLSSPVAATMIPMGGLTFTTTNGSAASANTAPTSSSSTATAASTAKKASARVQTRDRSNWRIDATPSAGSGTDSADVTPSSSPSSSPPSRAHRTSSFEDSELIAAFMDDGSNSSPLPSPAAALTKTTSSSSSSAAAGGVGSQSSSVSAAAVAAAKKARKNGSSRSSTDFTMAATAAAVAAKKDDSEIVLPPTRRPLQLLQRKELNKPAGGVWRIAVGPDPGNRGFGGRGRGRAVTK